MFRIAILSSTKGSNIPALHAAIQDGELQDVEIALILTNKPHALVTEKAADLNIPLLVVEQGDLPREQYDKRLIDFLEHHNIDLILLNGWMRILSKGFIDHFHGRIINIHPSLLPKFAGGMDMNVHQAVLDAGETETGCTLHFATEEPDAGPIIVQRVIPIAPDEDADSLKWKVQHEEQKALIEGIRLIKDGDATFENCNLS